MGEYLLGLDIGTTGAKAVLVDGAGGVVARATSEYPLHTPKPGWAEQDPEDWWRGTVEAVRRVMAEAGARPEEVRGIGLSGQQHGSVFLDKDGRVLREALLWCDQRTVAECEWIHETIGFDQVVVETLNPVLTGFQAPKIVWLQRNEPRLYERLRMILLPKDYIRYRMSGEYATEVSDAAGTSLLNVANRDWSEVMVRGLGLEMDMLPKVYESPVASAAVSADAAEELGLRAGIPIAGGGGDNACSAVGAGVIGEGVVAVSVGTSGTVFSAMSEPKMDPKLRVHTFCHAVPGQRRRPPGGELILTRSSPRRRRRPPSEAKGCSSFPISPGNAPPTRTPTRGARLWDWGSATPRDTWRGR